MRLDLSSPVILIAIAETLVWAAFFYTIPILLLHWEGDFGWAREDIALALTLALIVSAVASGLFRYSRIWLTHFRAISPSSPFGSGRPSGLTIRNSCKGG